MRLFAVQIDVLAGGLQRIVVDVDGDGVARAELACSDRQKARARADIDDRGAAERPLLQETEAEPGRRVMAGAESHRWANDDDDVVSR